MLTTAAGIRADEHCLIHSLHRFLFVCGFQPPTKSLNSKYPSNHIPVHTTVGRSNAWLQNYDFALSVSGRGSGNQTINCCPNLMRRRLFCIVCPTNYLPPPGPLFLSFESRLWHEFGKQSKAYLGQEFRRSPISLAPHRHHLFLGIWCLILILFMQICTQRNSD